MTATGRELSFATAGKRSFTFKILRPEARKPVRMWPFRRQLDCHAGRALRNSGPDALGRP